MALHIIDIMIFWVKVSLICKLARLFRADITSKILACWQILIWYLWWLFFYPILVSFIKIFIETLSLIQCTVSTTLSVSIQWRNNNGWILWISS
jgi:hypothetical protein